MISNAKNQIAWPFKLAEELSTETHVQPVFAQVRGKAPSVIDCLEQLGIPRSVSYGIDSSLTGLHTALARLDKDSKETLGRFGLRALLALVEAQPGHATLDFLP